VRVRDCDLFDFPKKNALASTLLSESSDGFDGCV
jgi:hypothetical protein